MHLYIIETGGTIASKREGETIDLGKTSVFDYQNRQKSDVSVTVRRPFYALSENLTPEHWLCLAKAVQDAVSGGADGVLILHGSDTLPYSAAALYFLLSDISVPVAITAANRPADDEASNAEANVKAAIDWLGSGKRGIYVFWENPDGVMRAYDPRRLTEALGDAFYTIDGEVSSFNNKGEIHVKEQPALLPCPMPARMSRFVGAVRPMPGLDYSTVAWQTAPVAVLHTLYHSGTVCANGENISFATLKERCQSENLPLYICPARARAEGVYASAAVLEGAIPLFGLSAEAAYTLLTLAYNQEAEQPEAVMKRFGG